MKVGAITTHRIEIRADVQVCFWPKAEMAVARVGGRLLGWSCRHCSTRATRGNLCPGLPPGAMNTGPQQEGPRRSGGRTDGLRASPVAGGPVVGASEMATGVVVGSVMILA